MTEVPERMYNGLHTVAGGGTNYNTGEDFDNSTYGSGWTTNGYYQFDFGAAYAINEWTVYYSTQGTSNWGYSNTDKHDDQVFRISGSNDASTWLELNSKDYNFYSQLQTHAWNYHEGYNQFNVICGKIACTTNMNNYRYFKIQLLNHPFSSSYKFSEIEFSYNKVYEAEYSSYTSAAAGTYLPLTGGDLSGQVTTNQTVFSSGNEFVSKQYVDHAVMTGLLSFTPNFNKATMYGKVDRNLLITVLQGSSVMFDGHIANQSASASDVSFFFNSSAQHAINEFTVWTQYSTDGSSSDNFRNKICEIYGSKGSDTAAPPSGNWVRLNENATVWVAEAIACPALMWEQYGQLYPQGFRFKCTTNMNNFNRYWLKFNFLVNPVYDVHWNYNKSHEADYS